MSANPFQKATRAQLKARVAFAGPTGAGKTWTALEWATVLANGAPIAFVDTERGSASLYSDHFTFDVMAFDPPYDPQRLTDILKVAEGHGYAVVVIDSLSHFWEGEGGTRDIADAAAARSGGNSFAGWKDATPKLRHLIDVMLGLDAHVVATMRSKMEYVIEQNERGKSAPRKVGLAPVMRAGVEYEFTLVGDIDLDHRIAITKSRCDRLADELVLPGRASEAAQLFADWLSEGKPVAPRHVVDALVARMNALHPEDKRKACKGEFVAAFGRPADLAADVVADAEALVAKFEQEETDPTCAPSAHVSLLAEPTTPTASATGAGGENDQGAGQPADLAGKDPESLMGEAEDPLPAPEDAWAAVDKAAFDRWQRGARATANGALSANKDEYQAQWEALVYAASGGAQTSSKALTKDQCGWLKTRLMDLSSGKGRLVETDDAQYLGWKVDV